MANYAAENLRRLMAREGLTLHDVVARSRLNKRTVKAVLHGRSKPHARTLHRLARGLGVRSDELFQNPSLLVYRAFDRATNPVVDEVVDQAPEWFEGWSQADYDSLYSRFGAGGQLTFAGAVEVVRQMNRQRDIQHKVALVLESGEAELLEQIVNLLYQRILAPAIVATEP